MLNKPTISKQITKNNLLPIKSNKKPTKIDKNIVGMFPIYEEVVAKLVASFLLLLK